MALTAWQRQQQQQQQPHKSPEEMGASPNIAKGSTDTLLPVLADAAGSSSSSSALLSAVTAAAACDPSGEYPCKPHCLMHSLHQNKSGCHATN